MTLCKPQSEPKRPAARRPPEPPPGRTPIGNPRSDIRHSPPQPMRNDVPEPVLGLPLDRAAAMLPADLLQGDETIILLLKPSLWFVVLSSLRSLGLILMLCAVVYLVRTQTDLLHVDLNGLFALAAVLAVARLIWASLDWIGRTYVLTDRRVIRIRGVLRIATFQCPLRQLQHTELHQSIRERLFMLGTISFATAGTAYPEAYWIMVPRPAAVHRKIVQTIGRYR
jgi:hypothetical protein